MNKKLRLVVMGIMGRTPLAGVSWQVLHYLEGFRRLGHDIYYIEDTGDWAYNPEQTTNYDDDFQYNINCEYAVNYIARLMSWYGLSDHWAYRSRIDARIFGLSDSQVSRILEQADALVNLTGSTWLFEEHLRVPVRIYLETDPVIRQFEVIRGDRDAIEQLSAHTHRFTYGENIGAPDCGVPLSQFDYRPTRQPIVLDWWTSNTSMHRDANCHAQTSPCYTTISNWRQSGKDIEWNGETYSWSKDVEFLKFIDLPRRTAQEIELALFCKEAKDAEAVPLLESHGWRVIDAIAVSKDILPYRDYILSSRGEFTVAKDQNIRLRSGWFSDRSACYLAAGKPVVTQDTAFDKVLPIGLGLFGFQTMEDILAAMDSIESDYERHCRAARDVAEEYFKAETVLAKILQDSGL